MIPDLDNPALREDKFFQTIRPIAAASLRGVASWEKFLLAIDSPDGYLWKIDPISNTATISNPHHCSAFMGATGLAIADDTLWYIKGRDIYYCSLKEDWIPRHFTSLPYSAEGIAVWESTIYVTCNRTGEILVFAKENAREITRLYAPGIGGEHITVKGEELWLCDAIEQTVYCLDRATGEVHFSILTPFENPTGITFHTDSVTGKEILYVAYANYEPYIRDNPNANPNHEIEYRDRTFIHPLHFHFYKQENYALSNGYLVEMCYVEELAPLEDNLEVEDLEWHIALPAETQRQEIVKVEPVGLPFTEKIIEGQRVAVFKFDKLTAQDRYVFGWKATLKLWSIKYQLQPQHWDNLPDLPPDFQERYLVDNDDLAMDTPIIRASAREAVGEATNLLQKMYNIRNYVYDRLSYGIKPHIDTPDVTLRRGVGSCGEYLGVLLALSRLNGIASRTVGRYKCPPQPELRHVPLQPDFNHVWMEFYLPGFGWLPMESNPDDIFEGGPYPTRFFMGLAWYHAEMAKGIPFEKLLSQGQPVDKEKLSLGELAINRVQFTILEELEAFRE